MVTAPVYRGRMVTAPVGACTAARPRCAMRPQGRSESPQLSPSPPPAGLRRGECRRRGGGGGAGRGRGGQKGRRGILFSFAFHIRDVVQDAAHWQDNAAVEEYEAGASRAGFHGPTRIRAWIRATGRLGGPVQPGSHGLRAGRGGPRWAANLQPGPVSKGPGRLGPGRRRVEAHGAKPAAARLGPLTAPRSHLGQMTRL